MVVKILFKYIFPCRKLSHSTGNKKNICRKNFNNKLSKFLMKAKEQFITFTKKVNHKSSHKQMDMYNMYITITNKKKEILLKGCRMLTRAPPCSINLFTMSCLNNVQCKHVSY